MYNIEIKAKCSNPAEVREKLLNEKADFKGTDFQTDTYFMVKEGRLKLRQGNIENSLIYYKRENISGSKKSSVILYKTTPDSTLKEILAQTLGILVEVKKKREIYFIDNVKFHIDEVESLGSFVEIEAINSVPNKEEIYFRSQCEKYISLLKINSDDLISISYSDMLLQK